MATHDKNLEVAAVYADALFELAHQAGNADDVRAELEELVKLEQIEPDFAAFMGSTALDDDHRAAGLEKIFRGKLSDLTLNTLLVMNRNGRFGMTSALLRDFILRQEEAAGQVEVQVVSAIALDEREKKAVTETAAKLSGKTPIVDFQVDPEILGGLIIQIGDKRYDNSARRQLREAKDRLLDRSERGLPIGAGHEA